MTGVLLGAFSVRIVREALSGQRDSFGAWMVKWDSQLKSLPGTERASTAALVMNGLCDGCNTKVSLTGVHELEGER